MTGAKYIPWTVTEDLMDREMYAVRGAYLVASNLPIEDAWLISAAPELLEALKEARENLWNYWVPNTPRGMQRREELLRKYDAAIAKAEGRS